MATAPGTLLTFTPSGTPLAFNPRGSTVYLGTKLPLVTHAGNGPVVPVGLVLVLNALLVSGGTNQLESPSPGGVVLGGVPKSVPFSKLARRIVGPRTFDF